MGEFESPGGGARYRCPFQSNWRMLLAPEVNEQVVKVSCKCSYPGDLEQPQAIAMQRELEF